MSKERIKKMLPGWFIDSGLYRFLQLIRLRLKTQLLCLRGNWASRWENFRRKNVDCDFPIDFVVTWVDSNDIAWQREKAKYGNKKFDADNSACRYREWDTLALWFRAVEKYAPWVRKVYFVTCGQKPDWLHVKNDKIVLVSHSDYIPAKYLPTFQCEPIELNLWKIPGLSEHFVYFNDDVFLNRPVMPSDFFADGLPKLCPVAKPLRALLHFGDRSDQKWLQQLLNDIGVINNSFDIRHQMELFSGKWFSYKLKSNVKYNKRLYEDGYCCGIQNQHSVYPILKSCMQELWDAEYNFLDETSSSKFRNENNITTFLVTLWMLFRGKFSPVNDGYFGACYNICPKNMERMIAALTETSHMIVCINDGNELSEQEVNACKAKLLAAFLEKLPEKSSFELYDHYITSINE